MYLNVSRRLADKILVSSPVNAIFALTSKSGISIKFPRYKMKITKYGLFRFLQNIKWLVFLIKNQRFPYRNSKKHEENDLFIPVF